MAVMTGARSGEDPSCIEHTAMGPRCEDACQGGQIHGRSKELVRNAGFEPRDPHRDATREPSNLPTARSTSSPRSRRARIVPDLSIRYDIGIDSIS